MKSKIFLLVLTLPILLQASPVCLLATGAPGLGTTFYGSTNCSQGNVDQIKVVGDLDIDRTVINQVTVTGDIDATQAQVGNITIKGILQANGSTFGTITSVSDVYLSSSSAQNIVINPDPDFNSEKIYLNNATVGNINFTGGGGLVILSNGSMIQGTVTGATVQNQGNVFQ